VESPQFVVRLFFLALRLVGFPVLLLHGSNDNHIPLAQAQALCRTVQAKNRPGELHVIQAGGHSANEWAALSASGGFPTILNARLLRNLAR